MSSNIVFVILRTWAPQINRTTTPTHHFSPDVRVAQIWRWSIRVLHSLLPFAPGNRRAARPCAHRLGTDTLKSENPSRKRVFAMDPDALVEALRGTMDPSLREAAERQLNKVKVELSGELWWRLWRGSGSGLGRWQHQDGAIAHIGRSFLCDEIRFSARYY